MSKSIKTLQKQADQAQSNLEKELHKSREKAITPQVEALLKELTQNTIQQNTNGLLHVTSSDTHYQDHEKTMSFGEWLRNTLIAAGIQFEYKSNQQTRPAETIDNTLSPDCGWDSSHYSRISEHTETTHYFTIDPTQPHFEKHLKDAVISTRLEARLREIGGKMNDEEKAALHTIIEKQIRADMAKVAGANRT